MKNKVRSIFSVVVLVAIIAAPTLAFQATVPAGPVPILAGRWRVKFTLIDSAEKNLIFDMQAKGAGTLTLLDTGVDDKPVAGLAPAAWSQLSGEQISFSSEVELQVGTCCRQLGTIIFKGKSTSKNSITGKLIFVTSIVEEESPYGFHSTVGTFTATRLNEN